MPLTAQNVTNETHSVLRVMWNEAGNYGFPGLHLGVTITLNFFRGLKPFYV